ISRLSFYSSLPRATGSPLFPYTTLFRSCYPSRRGCAPIGRVAAPIFDLPRAVESARELRDRAMKAAVDSRPRETARLLQRALRRSEEHTSELQSQSNLVCRLLLEKKKNN